MNKESVETVAAIVFRCMSVDRSSKIPTWARRKSHDENEAKARAIGIIAAARPHILEEAARIAEGTDVIHDAYDTDDCLSRQKTTERIAAAIRAAKEGTDV